MSTFFTSDLHFGHRSLDEHLRNIPTEECDNLIISNWNKIVHKQDLVYILGDITMEEPYRIEFFIKQLKGRIYVVGGNHDTRQCCSELNRLGIPVMGCIDYKGYTVTHIPVCEQELAFYRGNIHGHIHTFSRSMLPIDKYYNVNTEFHNYKPINFEEIEESFQNAKLAINSLKKLEQDEENL